MARSSKTKRSSTGRGSVLLISAFFLGSAAIRIGAGAGTAVAEGDLGTQLMMAAENPMKEEMEAEKPPVQISSLLEALQEREARVKEREQQQAMRKKALDIAQVEVERRIVALEQTEQKLRKTLAHAETAAEDDLARLTTVYENMKPKDAAALFEAMEPEFAAGFLARMRPDVAAKVMSGLDPQAAYSISAILAGRNARAPKS